MIDILSHIQKQCNDLIKSNAASYDSLVYKLKRLIDHKLIEVKWGNYSSEERQKRRKRTVDILTEGGIGIEKYNYEIAVIELYDVLLRINKELEKGEKISDDFFLSGLSTLIQMEMESIDKNQRMVGIHHIDIDLFQYLIDENLSAKDHPDLNELLIKLKKVHDLKK